MKIHQISFRNIGSYGDKIQTIDYDLPGRLILIHGKSGSGKSTLIGLPSLLLYGKIEGMKQAGIVNRVNKNGWIRGTLTNGDHEYVIERTFAPNGISVWRDGENIDSFGVKDAREFIQNTVVGMPYAIFNNIVSLSMTKFRSFLKMTATDRREIVDRMFSLEAVNEISNAVRKEMRDTGALINTDNGRIFTLNDNIGRAEAELARISEQTNISHDASVSENNAIIEEASRNIETLNAKSQQVSQLYSQYSAGYQQIQSELNDLGYRRRTVQSSLDLFAQGRCPTCGTSFDGEAFTPVKEGLVSQAQALDASIGRLNESFTQAQNDITKITQAQNELTSRIYQERGRIDKAQAENRAFLTAASHTTDFQSVRRMVDDYKGQLSEAEGVKSQHDETMSDLNILNAIYSGDGVKACVISNYLPRLNAEIAKMLPLLEFPYQLEFDAAFEPVLTSNGQTIGQETLSDGEHKRVDLAVLCCIYKLLKQKYPDINILSLDEVVSSIDPETISSVLTCLSDFAEEMGLAVFVVTHVLVDARYFSRCIQVTKSLGFSDFEILDT